MLKLWGELCWRGAGRVATEWRMALSSTSTLDEIIAAYVDNGDYDSPPVSVAKAHLFKHACRVLLLKMQKASSTDRVMVSLSPELVAKELEKVNQFISQMPDASTGAVGGGGVVQYDTSDFRGGGCV